MNKHKYVQNAKAFLILINTPSLKLLKEASQNSSIRIYRDNSNNNVIDIN